ncbi:hypothetical protein L1280_000537 [Deinococcus sp. HSC-46F16]|uniref:pPIWI_RE_Z domain-containing protein n=1 Tax=Deinococcus sp. HSC-46F16 TaxID=2910968 RepID=UPI0020A05256|nr:hypothetical protein [Deinococcus sp. HSC-46F16]MCP2013409.1 hypothetical protein [Deinococcus sp. HSC-46F16]
MDDAFTGWKGQASIQWACALMEQLGESDLELLPLVLSGSRAVESSPQAREHLTALRNTRRLTGKLLTRRAVQVAVKALNSRVKAGELDATYRIHPDTLKFTAAPGHGARIREAKALLNTPHERRAHGLTLAPTGDLVARLRAYSDPVEVPVRLTGLDLPAPEQHDLTRVPDADLTVTLAGLRATADRLDALDEGASWPAEHWRDRLENVIRLQRTTAGGLEDTDTLDLRGLKHLIGLPGAGKTTLISLLCAHLAEREKRVAVFFTSIETAREYLDRLRRYGTSTAMLVGRSESTHRKHGERLAELIAAQGNGGFGHTVPGADLFAQTCPLPAYAVNAKEAWARWEATDAPCEQVWEEEARRPSLCPLWSRCGRVKNQRDLVHANVWLGHVRSADTPVPAHTSPERLQYFELIAQTFDLVVFDEVDETQRTLDALGARALDLGGTPDSIHAEAQKVTRLALGGGLPVTDHRMYAHNYAANNFERQLIRLHEEISRFEQEQGDLGLALENRLLTTNFLIRQALRHFDVEVDSRRRSAMYAFWDSAMYAAYNPDRPPPAPHVEEGLGWTRGELEERWNALVESLKRYWHQVPRAEDFDEEMEVLAGHFARLVSPEHHKGLAPVARLTVTVGFAIAAYQELVRATRPLANHDILPQAVRSQASRALELFVARNLLGTFSSVRYRRKDSGPGFDIDYLVLDTVPRLLLHRLHEEGANVLLTSATSWMPDSTAYHVGVKPDYVLRPKRQEETRLTLQFRPVMHPQRHEPLRVSGAGRHRLSNLRQIVRQLARPGVGGGLSELERSARSMATPRGRTRQCALVVNSYAQVVEVVREIAQINPKLALQTRGVVKERPEAPGPSERYVLRGQVEALGHEEDVTVIVFPMTALGRGVNIVFHTDDEDNGSAAIGSLYFLIRPHPVVGDLTLMLAGVARATEEFDRQTFPQGDLHEVQEAQAETRKKLYTGTMRLLARPMSASMLPDEYLRPFSANLLIPILQTIGRAIRRSRPAEVYFVDAAWAPESAKGKQDSERTSVLVGMQKLLHGYVTRSDPGEQAIFQALYAPFAEAFGDIENLGPGGVFTPEEDEDDTYTTAPLEDEGDEEDDE